MLTIIGTGGSGGWFCQLLAKSNSDEPVVLIDKDKWEKHNMSRQFCGYRDIGKPKTEVFKRMLKDREVKSYHEYLAKSSPVYQDLLNEESDLILYVAVDNHPARMTAYGLADERYFEHGRHTLVISVANEYETASAWVYIPTWFNSPKDPRVRWPEIRTDIANDPLSPSCTGEDAESAPQLALSNMLSATAGAWLLRAWTEVLEKFNAALNGDTEMLTKLYDKMPVLVEYTNMHCKTTYFGD